MTLQDGTSRVHGEEAAIFNSSPSLSEAMARQEVRAPVFERFGGLRTAVIVTAVFMGTVVRQADAVGAT
jgi:hypothetical protein